MAPVFDKALFESFRKKAITDQSQLVVGNTYYIDKYGKSKLLRFLTNNEQYRLNRLTYKEMMEIQLNGWKLSIMTTIIKQCRHVPFL